MSVREVLFRCARFRRALGSQTFPTKEWLHLGAFEATYAKREQLFVFPDPKYVRYIKVRFNTHHGDEASCTVSQLKVHGITVMEGMQDDLQRHQKELEEQMESIGEDLPPDEAEVSEEGDAKPADRKGPRRRPPLKRPRAVAELRRRRRLWPSRRCGTGHTRQCYKCYNSTIGSRMVDAVTGVVDVVIGKANKTTTTLPDEIEVIEPVAPASADEPVVVEEAPVVEVVNASNATVSVNTTNATVSANATVSDERDGAQRDGRGERDERDSTGSSKRDARERDGGERDAGDATTAGLRHWTSSGSKLRCSPKARARTRRRRWAQARSSRASSRRTGRIRAFEISHSIYELRTWGTSRRLRGDRSNLTKRWTTAHQSCARTRRRSSSRGGGGGTVREHSPRPAPHCVGFHTRHPAR